MMLQHAMRLFDDAYAIASEQSRKILRPRVVLGGARATKNGHGVFSRLDYFLEAGFGKCPEWALLPYVGVWCGVDALVHPGDVWQAVKSVGVFFGAEQGEGE